MITDRIYFESSATTKTDPLQRDATLPHYQTNCGTTSSLYTFVEALEVISSIRESGCIFNDETPHESGSEYEVFD